MLARTNSFTLLGLDALPVAVDVHAQHGLPQLIIIGLPDQAVKEARERVRTAILNSQLELPTTKYVVNLAPADLRKEGGAFDLPIALGLLAASGQADPKAVASVAAVGELALDGSVRPVAGVLPIALAVRRRPQRLLVPADNAAEAAMVPGLDIVPVNTLAEAVQRLTGDALPRPSARKPRARQSPDAPDFADVSGQAAIKRALEVAVAGGHHALFIGPPGAGKTMLAQRLPSILPAWPLDDAIEATAIHSIAGLLDGRPLLDARPFRAPHHTSSAIALIGGGPSPKPGEISLAHHGVLFLDELPEFRRDALESLRQPLEDGRVTVARAKRTVRFPARFMLVAAMNPCPCGYATDPRRACRCPSTKVAAYRARISGPLLDRIDMHIEVPAVPFDALADAPSGETSAQIQKRVTAAQRWRAKRKQKVPNARLGAPEMKRVCRLTAESGRLLRTSMRDLGLSARSYAKILKIARTVADLAQSEGLESAHVAEALRYRSLDRQAWS